MPGTAPRGRARKLCEEASQRTSLSGMMYTCFFGCSCPCCTMSLRFCTTHSAAASGLHALHP